MVQILELFGGIGSPRCALRNLNIPTKAIDYVEIDENAVRSYNAMFAEELEYKTQSVVGWNLTPMKDISEFLLNNDEVPPVYDVTQPSVYSVIGEKGIRRATVIKDFAYTITTRQDRTPAQVIDCGNGRYRYLTERECWRLQGYTDKDYERAKAVQKRSGRYRMALYKQAGNSIAVPIFESMFRKIILHETA